MSAARVVHVGEVRPARTHRFIACVLALSLISGGVRVARAEGDDTAPGSRIGVLAAVVCGFAMKLVIPAPVPWAGVAAAACGLAFLDALAAPDNPPGPASDPPSKP
jgi:hypothetical protein